MKVGRFTLPGEKGMEKVIPELVEKWQADAIRDSDGTELSQELIDMGLQVYSTLCLIRDGNEWLSHHPECRQQIYLCTPRNTAFDSTLQIEIMNGYFARQFEPNTDVNLGRYWQVMDRTEGEALSGSSWGYQNGVVTIKEAKRYHEYTVAFLAYQIWEPVSMYNHLTNDWDEEHRMPIDIRHEKAREFIMAYLKNWLTQHEKTEVVRFTTFFYNFDLVYNEKGKEKRVDWFGYASCVSEKALQDFAGEYGYELYPEDFVDAGKYNTPFENPSCKFLDWMDFNQRFVAARAKECVDLVHQAGKKAIMFLGDHWIGTEPYGNYFHEIGLDAVVGAAGDGVTTRMIADIPIKETEARFYPYFFPDTFYEGGDPVGSSEPIWMQCRRALILSPTNRMGYGGYLSMAYKFPDFIDHVTEIVNQFSLIHEEPQGTMLKKAGFKIGILNSWGKIRSWMTHQIAHSLWNQRCYSYLGVMEALAGLSFEVEFLSFTEIKERGIDADIGVIINAGDTGTAWSGGSNWKDMEVLEIIRGWVADGGGFIGVGEPTACEFQGKLFQLDDVMGVQKEMGFTASTDKCAHYITEDICGEIDYGEGMTMVAPLHEDVAVLDIRNRSCMLGANTYGRGRSVYLAGLPFSLSNTRLLQRALYWAAQKEEELYDCFSTNINTECYYYPEVRKICVINNSDEKQDTTLVFEYKKIKELTLSSMEMQWITM